MKKTTIYIVRHGQSIGNLERLYLGHTDLDLSDLGHRQAKMTAEHLKDVNFSAIYTSDLQRAYNTAVPHAEIRNMEIIPSKELRELYLGDWEGKKVDDLIQYENELFIEGWHNKFGTFTLPNGENVMEGGNRFKNEVERIAKLHEGETILITAHAAVIRVFWAIISGYKPEEIAEAVKFPSNASYSKLTYDGEHFIPIEYSKDEHIIDKTFIS
jgi:broad specificity phosphatase PhoE